MRILQFMASGALGGGAVHLQGLGQALASAGCHITYAVGNDGPLAARLEALGAIVHRLPRAPRGLSDARVAYALLKLMREGRYDLVHAHGTRAAFWAGCIRRSIRKIPLPIVYTTHGLGFRHAGVGVKHFARKQLERFALRSADGLISVSRRDLRAMAELSDLPSHQMVHLPNAVNAAHFGRLSKLEAREALGIAADDFVVGTVSRLVPQKNVGLLLEATARLREVRVVIVGTGPQEAALRNQAVALGVDAVFLGARDDPALVMAALDIVVLSSRWEGEPIVLLEAMAAQRPWVATATSGAEEVYECAPGAGELVAPEDPPALAAALLRLKKNVPLCLQRGEAGYRYVQGRSFANLAQSTLKFYETLVG